MAFKLFVVLCAILFVVFGDDKCSRHKTYINKFSQGKIDTITYGEPDYQVIFVLLDSGDLYRSKDAGKTFQQCTGISSKIDEVFKTPDSKKYYFLDSTGRFWVTKDNGETFSRQGSADTDKDFTGPQVHPTNADWILAGKSTCTGFFNCKVALYVSTDFAQTWTLVKPHVNEPHWSWGDAGKYGIPEKNIHFLWSESDSSTYTYGNSKDLGAKIDYTISNALALLHTDSYFFVAQSLAGKLSLYAGYSNASSLKPCRFPVSLPENRYSILDTSSGSAFLNVDHSSPNEFGWGNTYVANSFADPTFSLSLGYNRRQGGKVDFARVKGVEGIYIANQWSRASPTPEVTRDTPLQTHITFNGGGKWKRLAKPTNVPCGSDCTGLNLVGRSNRRNIPSFYSTSKAIGLIIAAGNVLKTLRDTSPSDLDTYFSRDAGLTWERIRNGAFHYQFLDHGGIIALADFVNPTSKYVYSFNEGKDWHECSFIGDDQPVKINSLSYPPNPTHLSYYMIGERSAPSLTGYIITVDFSDLHDSICDPQKDYETFSPHDDSQCQLGAKVAYKRRKRESECFNKDLVEVTTSFERCPCTADDWECDICYQATSEGECVPINTPACASIPEPSPPADCKSVYSVSKGYRLVANTRCNPFDPKSLSRFILKPCPSSGNSSSIKIAGLVIFFVLLLALIGGAFYLRKTNENFKERTDEWWEKISSCFKGARDSAVGYSSLSGRGAAEPQDHDDEDYDKLLNHEYKGAANPSSKLDEKEDFI